MILGIGIDLAKVSRYEKLLDKDGFLERFFPEEEIEYIRSKGAGAAQSMAGRFAAREAFLKALGTGFNGFSPKDIKVLNNENGRPEITVNKVIEDKLNSMAERWRIHLSISHEKEYAIAQVVLED